MTSILAQPIRLAIAILILTVVFGLIERIWPAIPRQAKWRPRGQVGVDLCYWFFNPIVTKSITGFCAAMVVLFVVAVSGLDLDQVRTSGFGPVVHQPMWLIVFEMLFLGDFIGYWIHRAFHVVPDLWDVHAIHHSSESLDWLSSARVHPLNDVISKTLRVIPFVLLGFPLTAVVAYVPLLTFLGILLHANVPWRFGPLGYVIASPVFHRWHHTSADEGLNKNFAGLFPVIDMMFGTWYMPAYQPTQFGVHETIPGNFLRQLVYPFKPDRPATSPDRLASET